MSRLALTADCDLVVPALPRITVAIVAGRHVGALAYALRASLVRPAVVDMVHARIDVPPTAVTVLDVRELEGPVGDSLVAETKATDMLVVQVSKAPVGEHVTQLRRQAGCLLIEVDSCGCATRVSRPVLSR